MDAVSVKLYPKCTQHMSHLFLQKALWYIRPVAVTMCGGLEGLMDAIKQKWIVESIQDGVPMYFMKEARFSKKETSDETHKLQQGKLMIDDEERDAVNEAFGQMDWELQDINIIMNIYIWYVLNAVWEQFKSGYSFSETVLKLQFQ